jgi:hypothetical protein
MQTGFFHSVLPGSIVPYRWLLQSAFFFSLIVAGILLFMVIYLYQHRRQQQKKRELRHLYADLIAEITLCESEDERRTALHAFLAQNTALLRQRFPRKVLIRELVRTRSNISGSAAENIRWLYETLDLDRDTLKRFSSSQWNQKATAIQHLAALQQSRHLVKIYRETNNCNVRIRNEAQLAVVKLTGFKGLRFLNIISYPVSQWQQLSLISQLQEGEMQEEMISRWLLSGNDSVVAFALRLIGGYKCYDLHTAVEHCLQHPCSIVRIEALLALKEISNNTTAGVLRNHFVKASKEEQLLILGLLPQVEGFDRQLAFLTSLLQHNDEAIRYRSLQLIQQISPAWSTVVMRQVKDNPSFTYILSSLNKKVV